MVLNVIVSGRVQGVGYRGWALGMANRLGIKGWVTNLPNRNVEMMLSGKEEILNKMLAECWRGPALARVDNMVVNEIKNDYDVGDVFKVI